MLYCLVGEVSSTINLSVKISFVLHIWKMESIDSDEDVEILRDQAVTDHFEAPECIVTELNKLKQYWFI